MNIISLFQSLVNHLSNILENNLFLHELEHNIFNSTNELNLDILKNWPKAITIPYKVTKYLNKNYIFMINDVQTDISSFIN